MRDSKPTVPKRLCLILTILLAVCLSLTGCDTRTETMTDSQEDSPNWQSQYDLGIRLLEEGEYEEAIMAFLAAIEIDPKRPDAYQSLADVYLATDEPQKAADILSRGLEAAEDAQELLSRLEKLKEQYPACSIPALSDGQNGNGPKAEADVGQDPRSDASIHGMEEAIPAQFDFAAPFREGYARVGRLLEDGTMKYFFIDENGRTVSREYDILYDFQEGLALAGLQDSDDEYMQTYRYCYINPAGEEVISLEEGVYGCSFYEGLAEIYWYEPNSDIVCTNLIDQKGTKILPFDLQTVDMGYGGYGQDWSDGRILYLTGREEDDFYYWNSVQYARLRGDEAFPVEVCDGATTFWLAQDYSVVGSQEGWRDEIYNAEGLYMRYSSVADAWEKGTLVNEAGETLAKNVQSVEVTTDGSLILGFADPQDENGYAVLYYALYSQAGERLSEDYVFLSEWSGGFIVSGENGEERNFTVTDRNMNPIFTTQARDISQIRYQSDMTVFVDDAVLPQMPAVLFYRSYTVAHENSIDYRRDILDASGQTLLTHEEGSSLSVLSQQYLIRQRKKEAVLYGLDGQEVALLSGIVDLYQTMYEKDGQPLYHYRLAEEQESGIYQSYFAYLEEQDGRPTLTKAEYEQYLDYNLYGPEELLTEQILTENTVSSLRGAIDITCPISLWQEGVQVTEAAGLSLIGNNLYKQADQVTFLEDRYEWEIRDLTLHTADGSWSSVVYDDLGFLSCNFISFKQGDKWGYLKAIR
ncbi:MAG: tetratricopeptide repeat protein [Lachnospiraceae bacterium]|jgi:hypothetical protein|nr:tetratricopeptide repeat protein [Lachnospiraceae bacterium]